MTNGVAVPARETDGAQNADPLLTRSASRGAGTEEGGFAWLTLNYLLGHLGRREVDTVAAIDLVRMSSSVPRPLRVDEGLDSGSCRPREQPSADSPLLDSMHGGRASAARTARSRGRRTMSIARHRDSAVDVPYKSTAGNNEVTAAAGRRLRADGICNECQGRKGGARRLHQQLVRRRPGV